MMWIRKRWLVRCGTALTVVSVLAACSSAAAPPTGVVEVVPTPQATTLPTEASSPTANTSPAASAAPSQSAPSQVITEPVEGGAIVPLLQGGGYVIFIRHGEVEGTNTATPTPECAEEENLSDEGRAQSSTIGAAFQSLGIPVGTIITSETCRTRDTAVIAFGRVDQQTADVADAAALATLLATPPQTGTNTVIVGHGSPHAEAAGVSLLARGQVAVYSPLGAGGIRELIRLQPDEWMGLTVGAAEPAPPQASAAAPISSPATSAASPAVTITATAAPFDPAGVALAVEQVADGFERPVFVTHAADGSGRMFVVEQGGTIRLLSDGSLFLDITDRVGARSNEQGLLGLAFHPQFRDNGLLYVNYTDRNGDTVVSRFSINSSGTGADAGSEQVLLRQDQPAANHNGGMLAFGPDGYLYIGLGDGGGRNDQFGNGQNRATWLGTILRIDVNAAAPYGIPSTNPFADGTAARPEIWAYGLRNPWRFSFDRETEELYIADVGQNRYEWLHVQPAGSPGGQNYGWPILEGTQCLQGTTCDRTGITQAVLSYDHSLGCSITGGYVYRGQQYPALEGAYLFGDYCSGRVWTATRDAAGDWRMAEMLQMDAQISSFGEDEAGEIYLTDLGGGRVYRVTAQEQ